MANRLHKLLGKYAGGKETVKSNEEMNRALKPDKDGLEKINIKDMKQSNSLRVIPSLPSTMHQATKIPEKLMKYLNRNFGNKLVIEASASNKSEDSSSSESELDDEGEISETSSDSGNTDICGSCISSTITSSTTHRSITSAKIKNTGRKLRSVTDDGSTKQAQIKKDKAFSMTNMTYATRFQVNASIKFYHIQ